MTNERDTAKMVEEFLRHMNALYTEAQIQVLISGNGATFYPANVDLYDRKTWPRLANASDMIPFFPPRHSPFSEESTGGTHETKGGK